MAQDPTADLFRQLASGVDIPAPGKLLSRIRPEDAARVLPGMPYSLLTNLAHMHFWQDLWLKKIRREKLPRFLEGDWRIPEALEFHDLRAAFLSGFDEACGLAESGPEPEIAKTLVAIAIHDAYHLGQINLIKRALRLSRRR